MMSQFNPARWVCDVELLFSEMMLGIVCSSLLPKLFMSYFFVFQGWCDAVTTLASSLETLLETYLKVGTILKHYFILLEWWFVIPGIQNHGDI